MSEDPATSHQAVIEVENMTFMGEFFMNRTCFNRLCTLDQGSQFEYALYSRLSLPVGTYFKGLEHTMLRAERRQAFNTEQDELQTVRADRKLEAELYKPRMRYRSSSRTTISDPRH